MSGRAEFLLGVIAFATLAMAVVQVGLIVGVIVATAKISRRVDRLSDQIEHELKPLFASLNSIGRDASHVVALAAAQVERADMLINDLTVRLGETLGQLQAAIMSPVREGQAWLSAFRAALNVLGTLRNAGRGRSRAEDDDALFI